MTLGLKLSLDAISFKISQVLQTGLQLWLKMTKQAIDFVGTGSANFDGSTNRIDIANAFSSTNNSFMAWIRFDTLGIMTFYDNTDAANNGIIFYYQNTFFSYLLNTRALNFTFTPVLGKWYHIAATFDGTISRFYLDGVEKVTDSFANTISVSGTSKLGASRTNTNLFDGLMAKVGIWAGTLTQAQINSIKEKTYSELTASEKTNLTSWYELDIDATDSHGSNNGTEV